MLILKQNSANSVPTPPAGKGTIFLDDSDTLSVKTSDGNVETFPTVAAANTQVVFIDGTSLSGNANLTYNKNTDTLTLSGTLAAGNVKTNNLLYANGSPWDLQQPGGSNTQIQYNDEDQFGGSAAFTFNKSSNLVSMGGGLTVTGNASAGNLSTGGVLSVTGNANVGNLGTGGLIVATGNVTGGNLVTTGTASVGELNASGNAVITGNLTVNGNITYVNVDTLQVEDPIIELGGGPNGAPLTNNDGKDRGTLLHYYTTSAIDAFMGWDNSNGEFGLGSNVSIVNDVITFNSYGNLRANVFFGNGSGLTAIAGGNVTGQVANALVAGTVYTAAQPNITSVGTLSSLGVSGNVTAPNLIANTGAFYGNAAGLTNIPGGNIVGNISGNISNANYAAFAGQVVDSTQSNITAVGKLTSLLAGTDATSADFTNATVIAAKGNSGVTSTASVGLVGEGVSTDSGNSSAEAIGLFGIGSANGSAKGTGIQGTATVKATGDTGAAVGVRGISSATHAGGYNIGVLGNAAGSGVGNYAFYVQAGDIASIEANTLWDLYDNSSGALSFNSSGKAGIIAVSTADGSEGVTMSGTLAVTGNITATAGIKTDNYYYANGSPVDFQQTGGSNTDIQFNDNGNFGGSNAFTFNKTSNLVTMSGNLSVANIQATGDVTTATLTSNGNANVGNLGTAGLITATGNVSGGNLTTVGVVSATGNVSGGNITTGGVVSATGNVSGGNLTTGGALSVTGNANVGNLGSGGLITAVGNVSGGNLTTAGALSVTGNANVGNIGTTHVVVTGNVTGNLLPSANVTYDLGSDTQRWRDLYLAGNTITLGSQTLGANSTSLQLSGVLTANGAGLSYLNASNLATGTVPAARMSGTYTITVDGSANTVRDAAQPNITSVGTLTSLAVTGNVTAGNMYANSGTIGASLLTGTLTTAAQPNITSIGTLTSLATSGNITAGNVYANSGTIGASLLTGTLTTAAQPNVTSVGTLTSLTVTGTATAGNLSTGGTLSVTGNANVGNLGTGGLIVATGNVTGGNITTAGQLVSSVSTGTAPLVVSSTTKVTNLNADLLDGFSTDTAATANTVVVRDTNGSFSANVVTANLSGNATTAGTVVTAAQPNITSVGTLTSLSVTGNVAAGNLTTTGVLSVTGTGVSSIAGNLDMTSNTIINLATPTNPTDAATKQYVDDVAQGLNIHDSCAAATPDTLANITSGTISYNNGSNGVGAYLSTTGTFNLIDGVNVQTSGTRILVKNEANAVFNGIYTYTNTTAITRATDFNTVPEVEAGDFTFVTGGTLYDNTGWVQTESPTGIGTAGNNISFTQFSGAGTYNAGTGLTLTGSTFSVNVAQPTITSLGTLTGLGVNGNITAANITANTGIFSGNGSGLSQLTGANVTGQVANATVAGTVYTAAQPNITSVGTLTSLAVTGNITAGNVTGANLLSANFVTGTLTTAAQPNITSVGTLTGLGVNGTITGVNITANTGVFTGNGSSLSALNASNLSTGTVPSARLSGSYSISVDSATTAGTVTTAAQPNITSVGTLTSLTVSGNVGANHFNATNSVVASTLTSNVATGTAPLTVTSTTRVANLNVAYANVADFINISDVTTGTYYPVLANAATGNVSEGSNSALSFAAATGTLSATVFSGSGASLTNLNASNISSGTLAQARLANSSLTVNGTAISLGGSATITANTTQTLTFGSYLTGTSFNGGTANTIAVDATSAATASKVVARDVNGSFSANVITANSFAGAATTAATVTTAAQPNITSVGQLTSLAVTGNITANNFICNAFFDASVNAAVSAAGTVQGNATVIATEINVVSTVASGAGVALPTAVAGIRVTLINTAANALLVYPASGGQINSLGTNASYSLAAGGRLEFVATSTTQWYTMSAAYS